MAGGVGGRCGGMRERAVWAGGVRGRCGGMCGWAVWSALHLCGCTMWGAWLGGAWLGGAWPGGAWLGGAWLGGARAAWMGEVCPARLTTGSNFSFANFQVLTPVSSPPEKRNSPAPRHAGYHPLTRRLRCHSTRCAERTVRPEARTPYGHGSSEYLVNIGLGRGTAQKRVTGGRWRRIVLGGVLAGQVVELGGSPRLWP